MTVPPAGPRGTPSRRSGRRGAIAWMGAGLFAGSLLYFLFSYVVTFREIPPGPFRAGDLAVNVGLFAVFALHHSLFAREGVRAWVARTCSAAVERSIYVWAASLMLIVVCLLWRPIPGVAWQVRGPVRWLFAAGQLAGAYLAVRSAAIIDIWDLAGVRQAMSIPNSRFPPPNRAPSPWESGVSREFKTVGPYGWVRHPIYLGWFLLVFSVASMTMTQLVFAVVSCGYVLMAIPLEERSLARLSGGAYEQYMRKVRWKLVPHVY